MLQGLLKANITPVLIVSTSITAVNGAARTRPDALGRPGAEQP
jgi:hypothetical protein